MVRVRLKMVLCLEKVGVVCSTGSQSFQMFFYLLNLDEWGADFAPTMREALKCWNMTVQHWLGKFYLDEGWGADFAPTMREALKCWNTTVQHWLGKLNLDEWGADFPPTMRKALKCWNMTVQHWLGKLNIKPVLRIRDVYPGS
jgi:hypothetical protein